MSPLNALAVLALLVGCGGGGGDSAPVESPKPMLVRFEFEPNMCAFDSREALELAKTQYPEDFGFCFVSFVGNELNGKPWPARSWPSTPVLNGSVRVNSGFDESNPDQGDDDVDG